MTLPETFVAAWERSEFVVDNEPVAHAGRAVWVEAGDAYVDVRGPGWFASGTTFAGTTAWADSHLTWTHLIDAEPDGDGVDHGLISFVGDDLIEEGEFNAGRVVRYRERWQRLPGSNGVVLAATRDGGIAVRVGDHASVVVDRRAEGGGIAARYDRWDGNEWKPALAFGSSAERDRLPDPLDPDAEPPEGWRWT
jgi:hypothetical protein